MRYYLNSMKMKLSKYSYTSLKQLLTFIAIL
jgi:hypothetical protein